jgi:hypothetical protein
LNLQLHQARFFSLLSYATKYPEAELGCSPLHVACCLFMDRHWCRHVAFSSCVVVVFYDHADLLYSILYTQTHTHAPLEVDFGVFSITTRSHAVKNNEHHMQPKPKWHVGLQRNCPIVFCTSNPKAPFWPSHLDLSDHDPELFRGCLRCCSLHLPCAPLLAAKTYSQWDACLWVYLRFTV